MSVKTNGNVIQSQREVAIDLLRRRAVQMTIGEVGWWHMNEVMEADEIDSDGSVIESSDSGFRYWLAGEELDYKGATNPVAPGCKDWGCTMLLAHANLYIDPAHTWIYVGQNQGTTARVCERALLAAINERDHERRWTSVVDWNDRTERTETEVIAVYWRAHDMLLEGIWQ